jgi:hypothetical protein
MAETLTILRLGVPPTLILPGWSRPDASSAASMALHPPNHRAAFDAHFTRNVTAVSENEDQQAA